MTNCYPCVLPMAVGADLASIPLPGVPDKDHSIVAAYAKLVGELLYISINTIKHLKLTWCAKTVKAPFQRGQLFGFADASWAADKSSRCSTLCYDLCWNSAAFSHGNQLSLLSSLSLVVRRSSSAWLPALK